MKILVKKMSRLGLLKVHLILGTVIMAVAFIGLPVGVLFIDPMLFTEPTALFIIAGGMLFFGSVGYFIYVRPYLLYQKTPDVQVEADDEFLYIHTIKKEAKIPLAEIEDITVFPDLPFIYHRSFLREMIIHEFSEQYGNIDLDIANFGSFKFRFVPQVEATSDTLFQFLRETMGV
jgi:hypothetical protein